MAKFITEADIKPAFKFATGATKKLVTAGVTAADNFPELLSKYKWSGTRDYNMAMIIIALYAYCAQQEDKDLKKFGMSAKLDQSNKSVFEFLEDGNGTLLETQLKIKLNIYSVIKLILKKVFPKLEEDKLNENAQKLQSEFLKQVKKMTPWKVNDRDVQLCILQLTNKIQGQKEAANKDELAVYEELKLILNNEIDALTKENEKITNELKQNKELNEKQIKELESKLSDTKKILTNLGKNYNINTAALNDIMEKYPSLNKGIIAKEIEKIATTKEFTTKIATAQKATENLEQQLETNRKRRIANEKRFNQTNPQGAPKTRSQSMVQNRVSFFENEGPIKPRANTNTANVKLDTELAKMNEIKNLSQQLARQVNSYDLKALTVTKLNDIIKLYNNKKITDVLYVEKLPEIKANPEKNINTYLNELHAFADGIKEYATAGGNDPEDFKNAMKKFGESTEQISNALKSIKFYVGKEEKSSVFTGGYPYRYIYFSKNDEQILEKGNEEGIEKSGSSYYYKTEDKDKAEGYLQGKGGYIINV